MRLVLKNNGRIFASLDFNNETEKEAARDSLEKTAKLNNFINYAIGEVAEDDFKKESEDLISPEDKIKSKLKALDSLLPRYAEDLIQDELTLPQIMRDRLNQKKQLRDQLHLL
jgi:hypothetical protein